MDELCEADLLLHVLDASSPAVSQQREAVLQVCTKLQQQLVTCAVHKHPPAFVVDIVDAQPIIADHSGILCSLPMARTLA